MGIQSNGICCVTQHLLCFLGENEIFSNKCHPTSLLRKIDFDVSWALFGTLAHFLVYVIMRLVCIKVYQKWIREALKKMVKFRKKFP